MGTFGYLTYISENTSTFEKLLPLTEDMQEIMSSSSENSGSSTTSSSESDIDEAFQDDIVGDDNAVMFPLLQMILHGRRRPKVQDYLDVVHQKSDDHFRRDYRLTRETAYNLIGTVRHGIL